MKKFTGKGRMTKCRYAKKYKATREPSCGCDMCDIKWAMKQQEISFKKQLEELREEALGAARSASSSAGAALYVANYCR